MQRNNTFKKKGQIQNDGKGEEKEINTYGILTMCQTFYIYYRKESCRNSACLQKMELRLREVKESVQGHQANVIDGLY